MKTLYISDLDGSLLSSQAKVSESTKDIMNHLIENGMHFTYATARSLQSSMKVCDGLHLKVPVIVYNGAFIIDSKNSSILYSQYFSKQESRSILSYLMQQQLFPFVYSFIDGIERVSYMEGELHQGERFYLSSRPNDERFRSVSSEEDLLAGDIFYITCINDKEILLPHYEYLSEQNFARVLFQQELYREEYWLECMPKKASKARAIKKLKELNDYNRIISFGDGVNDLSMFEISDECYAMENAAQVVKEKASGCIESNDQDGVAKWLLNNFLKY